MIRAFRVPSLILIDHADPEAALARRAREPYFLYQNWRHSVLYSENAHVPVHRTGPDATVRRMEDFLEAVGKR